MKLFACAFSALLFVPFTYAAQQSPLHGEIRCEVGVCTDIEPPVNTRSWCDDNENTETFSLDLAELATHRISEGEFMIGDGDQFTSYVFNGAELEALKSGEAISGLRKDGYSWSDGDHYRYQQELFCVKQ